MNSAVSGYAWNWNDCFEPSAMPVRRAAPEVARVDVGAAVDEDLDHFVQAAERRAVERGEVGFVHRVDVGAGVEQDR